MNYKRERKLWGAHAPRVLAVAPPPLRTFFGETNFGEAPKWAREARALSRPESHPSEIVWSFGVWCFLEIWILDSRFHRSVH